MTRRNIRYFLCGINKYGKPFVVGPYLDENDAQQEGWTQCRDCEWEIKEYPTIQTSEAVKMWKLEVARKYSDINMGFQRASHKTDQQPV